jgi:hypothetical protein
VLNKYISPTQIIVDKIITNTGAVSTPTYFPNNNTETIIGKITRESASIYIIDTYYDLLESKNIPLEYVTTLPSVTDINNFPGRTVLVSTDGFIYTFKDGVWVIGKSTEVIRSATAPSNPIPGMLWFRTTDSRMFSWDAIQEIWIQVISGTIGDRIDLSNESHSVSANSDGTLPSGSLDNAFTLISIYAGGVNVTNSWTITATPSAGITGSLTTSGSDKLYTVTGITQNTDSGTVTFTATRNGYANLQAVFSITKSKAGVAGGGSVYQINPSVGAIKKLSSTFTPAIVTFTATTTTGGGSPTPYNGRFKILTSTDGINYTEVVASTVDESSKSYTIPTSPPSAANFIKGEVYAAGGFSTLLDYESLPVIVDGVDGSSGATVNRIDLTNDTTVVPVVNGSPVLTYANTQVKVYEGINDTTANWTISVISQLPVGSITGTLTGTNYQVDTLNSDSATVTFQATRTGYSPLTAVFDISRVYSADYYYISPSVDAIKKPNTTTYNPSSITFSAFKISGNGTPVAYSGRIKVYVSTDGSNYSEVYNGGGVDQTSYTYTLPALPNNNIYVRGSLFIAGGAGAALDSETIPIILDGTSGGTGAAGNSARIAYAKISSASSFNTDTTPVVVSGDAVPGNANWGLSTTWATSPYTIVANETLYQVTGTYNPTTNQTTWNGPPYISALKVGSLSAITVNTGALSVDNILTIGNTGKIISTGASYNSPGIFLGYDSTAYKFSIGNGTNNLSFDGTNLSIPGQFLTTSSVSTTAIATNAVTIGVTSETDASLGLTTTWQDAVTANITVPAGAEVDIYFSLAISGSVSSAATAGGSAFVRILRDATEIYGSTPISSIAAYDGTAEYYVGGVLTLSDFNSPKSTSSLASGMDFDSPGAGTYTYKIQVQKDSGVWAVEKRKLKLVLRKR